MSQMRTQKLNKRNRRSKKKQAAGAPGQSQVPPEHEIFTAVQNGNFDRVVELITGGVDVNITDMHQQPQFNADGPLVHVGMTPLYYAVSRNMTHLPFAYQRYGRDNYYQIAEFLIQRGANVNARTREWFAGWSPIHWAAEYLNLDMVQLLLSNGANLDAHYQLNQRGNRANLAYAFGIRAQQFINDVA